MEIKNNKIPNVIEPELSIVIPHYNSPVSLRRLLQCILKEYTRNIEVIVIDDNSTEFIDSYNEVVRDFSHDVSFLVNETNQNSAGTCRNIGIKKALGEWIIFCDADDYLCEGWYDVLSKDFDEPYDIIYYPPTSIDESTGQSCGRELPYIKKINEYISKRNGAESRIRYNWYSPCSKMIRKRIIDKNNITFESVLYGNDVLFSSKAGYFAEKIHVNNRPYYCITKSVGGLTDVKKIEAYSVRDDVAIRNYKYLDERLSHKEKLEIGLYILPVGSIIRALKRKYSYSDCCALLHKYKKNRIKLFSVNTILSALKLMVK